MRPCWQAAGLGFCGQHGAALDPAHWLAHKAAQLGAGRSAFFPSHAAPAQAGEGFWPARTPAENPAARPRGAPRSSAPTLPSLRRPLAEERCTENWAPRNGLPHSMPVMPGVWLCDSWAHLTYQVTSSLLGPQALRARRRPCSCPPCTAAAQVNNGPVQESLLCMQVVVLLPEESPV